MVFILLFCSLLFIIMLRKVLLIVDVQGCSMAPWLQNGDRVLVLRYWPIRWLYRGQVVVIRSMSFDGATPVYSKKLYIKRITALAPDKHQTLDKNKNKKSWQIPDGYLFVEGDNAQNSIDSRHWGPVPDTNLTGVFICKFSQK